MEYKGYSYIRCIDFNMVKHKLPERISSAHKGTFGTLLCVCGSLGMSGAATMSISAAIRCGVGMVKAIIPRCIYEIVSKQVVEPIFIPLGNINEKTLCENHIPEIITSIESANAVMIGCGLGWSDDTRQILYTIINNANTPLIIDADGINLLSENIDILSHAKAQIVITPHMREMSRLMGLSVEKIKSDRAGCARSFAQEHGVIVVLKGENTIIADTNGDLFMNRNGNSGMAKGGSGDVLSGMIGSLLSQRISPIDATICSVYLHGLAGDKCAKKLSKTAMLPTDIINELPGIFLEIER